MKEKSVNQAAREMANARWKKTTPEERAAYASRISRGPRAGVQRCFCGANGMARAANHYFDCCRKAGVIILNLEKKRELHDGRRKETAVEGGAGSGAE